MLGSTILHLRNRRATSRTSLARALGASASTLCLYVDQLIAQGYVLEKVESFALDAAGDAFAITDNDGVDGGSNGETQFLRLGALPGLR